MRACPLSADAASLVRFYVATLPCQRCDAQSDVRLRSHNAC